MIVSPTPTMRSLTCWKTYLPKTRLRRLPTTTRPLSALSPVHRTLQPPPSLFLDAAPARSTPKSSFLLPFTYYPSSFPPPGSLSPPPNSLPHPDKNLPPPALRPPRLPQRPSRGPKSTHLRPRPERKPYQALCALQPRRSPTWRRSPRNLQERRTFCGSLSEYPATGDGYGSFVAEYTNDDGGGVVGEDI